MVKPKKIAPRKSNKKPGGMHRRVAEKHPMVGLLLLMLAVLTVVSIWDYSPEQSSQITTDAGPSETVEEGETEVVSNDNLVGKFGSSLAFWSIRYMGMGAWILPIYLIWLSYMYFFGKNDKLNWKKWVALVVSLISAASFFTMLETQLAMSVDKVYYSGGLGGIVGHSIFDIYLVSSLGRFGSTLIIFSCFVGCNILLLHDNIGQLKTIKAQLEVWKASREERKSEKAAKAKQRSEEKGKAFTAPPIKAKAKIEMPPVPEKKEEAAPSVPPTGVKLKKVKLETAPKKKVEPQSVEPEPVMDVEPEIDSGDVDFSKLAKISSKKEPEGEKPKTATPLKFTSKNPTPASNRSGLKIIAGAQTVKAKEQLPTKKGDYEFPSLNLLADSGDEDNSKMATEDHQKTAETLVQTLAEFGVKVTMGEVHAGPVITRYDVHPAPGVRVEKILNLDKNIALGLKAMSVRILAPVPGKGCVGIEVPNATPAAVSLRDILESEDWVKSKAEIPVALGKEVSGKPLIADLTKMPHLLIAGSTGAGKTVCINAVISSLLYKLSPEDVRFVMVDPKIVEMQVFNDLPHMLIPVVTDPKKVPAALKYLLKEMENRYKIFAKEGVRNIAGFNSKRAKDSAAEEQAKALEAELSPEERAAVSNIEVSRDDDIEVPDKLPYIVCIVDELADLMMVAPADIETCIARLAQLARAAGIHLVLATQRPSVNVITGVIKANLPSRIAFKVASKVDSRTILDAMGADHLIGRGDMLFLPPGSADLIRSQGAFVSDDEISGLVEFLKRNGPPTFDQSFQQSVEDDGEEGGGGSQEDYGDELVPDAIEVLRATKRASTSMLQRRLRIGYNRAARIMEILEDREIVGPENGAQPREILKDLDSLNL